MARNLLLLEGMKRPKRTSKTPARKKKPRSRPERRIVNPGDYILCSLEIQQRQQLMRPDVLLVRAIIYLFGVYAALHDVQLHAVSVLNSRLQYVLHDRHRNRVRFREDLHRSLAWVINAFRGRRGAVFSRPKEWPLEGPAAVANAIAHTIAAPVASGSVDKPSEWPGFSTSIADIGGFARREDRTNIYFGKNSSLPPYSVLSMHMPTLLLKHQGYRTAILDLKRRVKVAEATAKLEVAENDWEVMGPKNCLEVDPMASAPASISDLTRITPEFATGGNPLALEANKAMRATFRADYDRCRQRLLAGERDLIWPYGTYAMVETFGHTIAIPPPPLILAAAA